MQPLASTYTGLPAQTRFLAITSEKDDVGDGQSDHLLDELGRFHFRRRVTRNLLRRWRPSLQFLTHDDWREVEARGAALWDKTRSF